MVILGPIIDSIHVRIHQIRGAPDQLTIARCDNQQQISVAEPFTYNSDMLTNRLVLSSLVSSLV